MTNTIETIAKEQLSVLLESVIDGALKNVLRKILFSQDQDWKKIYELMIENMPEMKNNIAVQTINKLTDQNMPYVGMKATISYGSDSYPYEVISVKNPRKIVIREMDCKRINIEDGPFTENQIYEYFSNENNSTHVVTLRKDNRWRIEKTTQSVHLGHARKYIDPSF